MTFSILTICDSWVLTLVNNYCIGNLSRWLVTTVIASTFLEISSSRFSKKRMESETSTKWSICSSIPTNRSLWALPVCFVVDIFMFQLSISQFGSDTTCHNHNLWNSGWTIVQHLFDLINKSTDQNSKIVDKLTVRFNLLSRSWENVLENVREKEIHWNKRYNMQWRLLVAREKGLLEKSASMLRRWFNYYISPIVHCELFQLW